MDHEKLIELVRGYSFLYDLSDCKYSDNQRKDEAWRNIGKQLNVNSKHLIKIINIINYYSLIIKICQRTFK